MTLAVILLAFLASLASWGVASLVCRHGAKLGLLQAPNHRSAHDEPTPIGGGIGVVLAGTVAGMLLMKDAGREYGWAMVGLSLAIAAVSLRNDLREVRATVRLGVQMAVCAALLASLGEMPAVGIAPFASPGGILLSVLLLLFGVWWINLFNFMDGIDGMAGSQAVFMLAAGAGLAFWARPEVAADPVFTWMICVAAATTGFLWLNWPPARVFMGDVGSTYLAFMILAFALFTVQAGWLDYSVWLILGALFTADTSVTLIARIIGGERWYEAHCSHAYQRLARSLGDHRPVTLLALAINVLWLTSLAWASMARPQWTWGLVALAYAPLVGGAVMVGAGTPRRG
jgi:Fuc2NAc and GlcNAc transferase